MSAETLSNVTAQPLERVNMGVLKLQPGADPQTVAQQLGSVLPPEAKVLTAEQFVELERQFWRNETPIGFLFDTGAAIGFLISAIYIYQVLFQITDENLPEYAVLQSMGYPRWFFALLIASTSLILATAALPPAAILAAVLYRVCVAATMLDLQLTATRILTVGGLAALMAIGSASVANRRLRHADPAALM
jgi:putative ABC transport system permease protein